MTMYTKLMQTANSPDARDYGKAAPSADHDPTWNDIIGEDTQNETGEISRSGPALSGGTFRPGMLARAKPSAAQIAAIAADQQAVREAAQKPKPVKKSKR